MADLFSLQGSFGTTPALGYPSGDPSVGTPICQSMTLVNKVVNTITLDTDAPVSVPFLGVTQANVVILTTVGGLVRARLTSLSGSQQAVPVSPFFALIDIDQANFITALDLTRSPGQLTTVYVFLGQQT